MRLKTLSVVGFKSFADRTRIECEPGITAVVGPNGAGKSNLVDAIAWVMGTQATSTLRTQRMDDVIFAGTTTRPPLGRAEVSLTLENADGSLAVDLAEVTVTRRLYRDGTSEYEINGTPCRLLDIQELLADSGVGRHQHVIVGQGRIEAVLGAGPDEHRAVIEEAAGVIKHRQRRERATRRLEATAADIQRAVDLLTEERRRLGPLKRQARAAERYDSVRAEWRALRLWTGGQQVLAVLRSKWLSMGERTAEFERRFAPNDGLGPIFNDVSCASCNSGDGRGVIENALERIGTPDDDMRAAALQYVRKVSGFRQPAAHNADVFERAVDDITAATQRLLGELRVRGARSAAS